MSASDWVMIIGAVYLGLTQLLNIYLQYKTKTSIDEGAEKQIKASSAVAHTMNATREALKESSNKSEDIKTALQENTNITKSTHGLVNGQLSTYMQKMITMLEKFAAKYPKDPEIAVIVMEAKKELEIKEQKDAKIEGKNQ